MRAWKMQRVAHQVCSSEIQPQRKHNLPLQCGPVKCCVDNYPAGLTIHAGEDRIVEVNFVESVEDFGAKLQGNILPQRDALGDGEVALKEARPTQGIP
jgi:hypothetical protein